VCLALAEHGHSAVITARNVRGLPRREVRPEGTVERLPSFPRWGRRLLSFPAFFNPLWLAHIRRLARAHAVDVIMVRDLPLAPAALLASGGRWPVMLDMAENYPAMIADLWSEGRTRRFDYLVRNPRLVSAVERFTLRRVAHTLTVVEESSERLLGLGVPAERVSVVSNTPARARISALAPRNPGEPLRIVYLGLMESHRGIAEVLVAAQALAKAGVSFHLDLVGDGREYEHFRAYADQLGLTSEAVTFHGRLPHEAAIRVVARAHVGLVPHHATEAWNTTIPNKLFDYMAAGLAVVSSDAVPAARVTSDTGAGLVFRGGDGKHLAEVIQRYLDLSFWESCRRAGQEAIQSHYNWELDTERLLEAVSMVHSPRGRVQG
jgi:glycosyltransferase involved in cell wall biosynthesis